MRLEHEFIVPAPPDVVWAAVIDPERVAPCMPGATLTAVDGSSFSGGVKVKLGPVSLTYKGQGEFLETDEQARRVVIKASGKDSRGNGTASATVTVTLTEDGANTKGSVVTDLTVTGKPAQFGRGMIVEVGGKILDSFASCLASKLDTPGSSAQAAAPAAEPAASANGAAPAPAAAAATPAAAAPSEDDDAEEAAPPVKPKPARRRTATAKAASSATPTVSAEVSDTPATEAAPAAVVESEPAPRLQLVAEDQPAAPAKPAAREVNVTSSAEAIDLLDYAGPSVVKRVVPVVVGLLAAFVVIRRLRHRGRS